MIDADISTKIIFYLVGEFKLNPYFFAVLQRQ